MKNLKRLLCLALTGVMLSGMMVMGASATDFPDDEKIVNQEAVATMAALSIIEGKPDGNYDPEGLVTRAEMAKMIATAVNGGVAPSFGVKATPTYTDIGGTWAEQFIEYCTDMKYINGRGNGTFDPTGNVTGVEAAKMVLTALGYESRAYQLTGADWAINTNALAMRDCKPSLYEGLNGVSMNLPISRDTAAQIIWNGLQNKIVEYNPNVQITGSDITYGYEKSKTTTLLMLAYDANISSGTFKGNGKSIEALKDGQIRVEVDTFNGVSVSDRDAVGTNYGPKTATADLDIANIGETVKVIWKNEKNTPNGLDAKDKVYGVFTTGETVVYHTTKAGIQDVDADKNQIKFGDVKYDFVPGGTIEVNYGKSDTTLNAANLAALKVKTADDIKFVCNDNGEIVDAYVTERTFDVVAAVTSTKVSLLNLSNLTIADHEIYEDIAKNDIVMVTQLYKPAAKDATFIIEKADLLTGTVTKFYKADKIDVDGTTINADENAATLLDGDSHTNYDRKNDFSNNDLAKNFEFVMYGNRFVAAKCTDDVDKDYGVIVAATEGDAINGQSVRLILADGTKKTFTIDEDSKVGNKALAGKYYSETANNMTDLTDQTGLNTLVSYSIQNDGKIKMTALLKSAAATDYGTYTKATKSLTVDATTGDKVTTADAVAFVYYDYSGNGAEWKVYTAAELDTITGETMQLQYKLDNSDRVPVFAIQSDASVKSNTSDFRYLYITKAPGAYTEGNEKYTDVIGVDQNGDEITLKFEDDQTTEPKLQSGKFIQYKEGSNGLVDTGDVKLVTALGRVKEYDAARQLLVLDSGSMPVSKDVVIINVNTADGEAGAGAGINTADPVNLTYQNVVYLRDETDTTNGKPVIAVFVDDDKYIRMSSTITGGTAADVTLALKAGNVTADVASIGGAITVPAGRTLTITGTVTATELGYLTAEEGAKVVIKDAQTGITAAGWYKTAGSANTAAEGASNNSVAAVALSSNNIAAGATFEGKKVYEGSNGSAALGTSFKWVVTDADKIS